MMNLWSLQMNVMEWVVIWLFPFECVRAVLHHLLCE
ncbi:hypothetical protein PG2001B_1658 [Bifidobacterium pseudolongum subsp. globosum]|uniref:Uncharacterized protein n=1 Tax=Bifidobacterium pseudolongum subsp. globosum TaxID=1690 RepID=A0A4Q5ASV8_9BIFI|nr:hypothetical protein PG2001B_1658 [Bifidobacterium pseudolongum subsp. globosum]